MPKYKCTVPFIPSMGSVSPFIVSESTMETKEEQALWVLNDMRDHDGLRHLDHLPAGTKFQRIER